MGEVKGRAWHHALAIAIAIAIVAVLASSANAGLVRVGGVGWTPPTDDPYSVDSLAVYPTDGSIFTVNADSQTLQKFNSSGVMQWTAGGLGSSNGKLDTPLAVAVDSSGNVYVADTGNDRVQKFNGTTGAYMSQFGSSGSGNGQLNNPVGIDVAPNGNIYVLDGANYRVQYFNSSGTYQGQWGSLGAAAGFFNGARDIAVAPDGTVYTTETSNGRIQHFSAIGGNLDQVAPLFPYGGIDVASDNTVWAMRPYGNQLKHYSEDLSSLLATVPASMTHGQGNGSFYEPRDVTIDSADNLIVADSNNNRIQTLTSAGVYSSKFGSLGTGNGEFSSPHSVAKDSSGNVYVSDEFNDRVEKFDNTGAYVGTFGSTGTGNGQFDRPMGIAIDSSDNVWVADSNNDRIQKFNGTTLAYMTKFGTSGSGNGNLNTPIDVAIDGSGNFYVSDQGNNRVEKFTSALAYSTKWGSAGSADGQFATMRGIDVDASNNVWVADTGNNRIQEFSNTGVHSATWGTYGTAAGELNQPWDVYYGDDGFIYVANYGNNRVEKFDTGGVLQSTFGGWGTTNNKAKNPSSITFISGTSIYAVDRGNRRVAELDGDTIPPSGGDLSYADGFVGSAMISVTWDKGIDSESGIADWSLERQVGTLGAGGACTMSGTWTQIQSQPGTSPYDDSSLLEDKCYIFRLVVTDNADNITYYTSPSVVKTDFTNPGAFGLTAPTPTAPPAITNPPAGSGPACESTPAYDVLNPTLQWSSSVDTTLDHYILNFGADAPANIAGASTSYALGAHAVGTYNWSMTAYDAANHTTTSTQNPLSVALDGADPAAALSAPADNVWLNTTTPTLSFSASDDLCLTRIKVTIDGSTADVLPETATDYTTATLAQGAHTWNVTSYDSAGNSTATAQRDFGIDTNPPSAFSLISPTPTAPPAITNGQPAPACGSIPTYDSQTPTLDWNAATDVSLDHYIVNFQGDAPYTVNVPNTAKTLASHAVGYYDWSVTAYDEVGNNTTSTQNPLQVGIDGAAPTISGSVSSPYSTNTPTFNFTATDDLCKTRVRIKIDGNSVAVLPGDAITYTTGAITDGSHTLELIIFDAAGNWGTSGVMAFVSDVASPGAFTYTLPTNTAIPAITNPPGTPGPACESVRAYTSLTPDLDWTASVDANLTKYVLSFGSDAPVDVIAPTSQYTLAGLYAPGTYTLSVQAKDVVNHSTTITGSPIQVALDGADPDLTMNSPDDGDTTTDTTPTLSWSASDDRCLARVEVIVDGSTVDVLPYTAASYTTASLPDGPHSWSVKAYDGGGNVTQVTTNNFTIDSTAPTAFTLTQPTPAVLPAITNPSGASGPSCEAQNSFTSATPTLQWSASVDASLDHYELTFDGDTVDIPSGQTSYVLPATAAGTYDWSMVAVDASDNQVASNPATVEVGIDIAAPTVSPTSPSDNAWATTSPTFEWDADDDRCLARVSVLVDGLLVDVLPDTATEYTATGLTQGPHTWQITVYDAAGRVTSSPVRNIVVDTDAPTGTIDVPDLPAGGNVAITGTADDITSGVQDVTVAYNIHGLLLEEEACTAVPVANTWNCDWDVSQEGNGVFDVSYTIRDNAGNETVTPAAGQVSIDTVAPKLTPNKAIPKYLGSKSKPITFEIGTNELNPVSVTATWCGMVVDISSHQIDESILAEGRCTLRIDAVDAAYNHTVWTKSLVVDRHAPVFKRFTKKWVMGPTVKFKARDRLSGIKGGGVTVRLKHVGKNMLKVRIKDRAGNVRVKTFKVIRRLSLQKGALNKGLPLLGGYMFVHSDAGLAMCFSYNASGDSPYKAASKCRPAVKELQWRLRHWGYLPRDSGTSGDFTLSTVKAVQKFQREAGLSVVGTVGPKTREAIELKLISER